MTGNTLCQVCVNRDVALNEQTPTCYADVTAFLGILAGRS